jgi:hypothetical protein
MLRTSDGRAISPNVARRPDQKFLQTLPARLGPHDATRHVLAEHSIVVGPHGRRRPPPE